MAYIVALAAVPFLTALPVRGAAGRSMVTRTWLSDDGLPNNSVRRVISDRRGFLWVATGSGLARFDGRDFKEYPLPMAAGEAKFDVRDLTTPDGETLLMVPESGGLVQLRDGVFTVHPASAALGDRVLSEVFAEPDGTVWLGGGGGELLRWHGGQMATFGRADGLVRRNNRFTFARDAQGRTWIAIGDFIGYFDGGRLVRYPELIGAGLLIAPSRSGGLWVSTTERLLRIDDGHASVVRESAAWQPTERGGVQILCDDGRGTLWIGTRRQGLYALTGSDLMPVPLPHSAVNTLFADTDEGIWAGTNGGGLSRLHPRAFTLLDASSGLVDDMSTGVCEDGAGAIWCANRAGGFVRWRNGRFDRIAPEGGGTAYAITVCPDRQGNVWCGATDGLYRAGPDASSLALVSRDIRETHVLFGARDGAMWVGFGPDGFGCFRDGRFTALTAKDGYTGHRVKAVTEDPRGTLWVATDDRQVFERVDDRLVLRIGRAEMPGGLIYSMEFDSEGRLWLATSRGLVLKRGARLDLLTTNHGLPDDQLSTVLPDGKGRIWVGGRRGLFCMHENELLAAADGSATTANAITFGREDGVVGGSAINGMQPLAWRARDGRLWFGTHAGVLGIDPATTLPDHAPPRVYLDEVEVNRAPVRPHDVLRLVGGLNELQFTFTAPTFTAAEKVRLRHQLAPYDFGWIEDRGERRATYVRVPPGNYTLRVSAAFADGAWGADTLVLPIVVRPQWWQTLWFRIGLALAFVALVAGVVRLWSHRRLRLRLERLEREHALDKERARIARDLHDELGGSLTRIGLLADRIKRQAVAPELREPLAKLARSTRQLGGELESIVWTVSPKNNTWDRLAVFIEQYTHSFCRDAGIESTVTGTESVPAAPVAPEAQNHLLAVIKEALNNVAKHAQASQVRLALQVQEGQIVVEVADNGVGFDLAAPELAERNGLNNIRSRIADLGGTAAIRSAPEKGTAITVRLPLVAAAHHVPGAGSSS